MNILILSPYSDYLMPVFRALEIEGDTAQIITQPLQDNGAYVTDMVVSYGYRHIIKEPWLSQWKGLMINLHISYLPYNRGVSPNLWSWYEDTPKGVSIHYIDDSIDKGPLLVRRQVDISPHTTLSISYDTLHKEMGRLFLDNWYRLRRRTLNPYPYEESGSYHSTAQTESLLQKFPRRWETICDNVRRMGMEDRSHAGT